AGANRVARHHRSGALLPGRLLRHAGGGAGDRLQRGRDDVAVHADAVQRPGAVTAADLDIGGGLRIRAGADRVLVIIEDGQRDAAFALQRVDKGGDGAVADTLDLPLPAVDLDGRGDAPLAGARFRQEAVILQLDPVPPEIGVLEQGPDHAARDFLAGAVGDLLHDAAELYLQAARQIEPVIRFQHIGDAALPRLAVDPDDRLVGAPQILRVDRQVRHLPEVVIALLQRLEALLDRVLMRAGKRREHQFAGIGVSRMDRQLSAVFRGAHD